MRVLSPKARSTLRLLAARLPVPATQLLCRAAVELLAAAKERRELAGAVAELRLPSLRNASRLAVRPCFISEDLEGDSNAGAYRSYLDVPNDPAALSNALTSVLDDAAALPHGRAFELLVQEYIPRERHAVVFSADPATGSSDYAVISVAHGQEDVTAGSPNAETVYFRLHGGAIDRAYGSSALTDGELGQVWDLMTRAKDVIGGDVDLEIGFWMDRIFVFQARPAVFAKEQASAVFFDEAEIDSIAPVFKEVYFRHRRKRHQVYSLGARYGANFPRSAVIRREVLNGRDEGAIRSLLRTPYAYAAIGKTRPRRKEDFAVLRTEKLGEALSGVGRSHHLVTEVPLSRYAGYLGMLGENPWVEWIEGSIEDLFANPGKVMRRELNRLEPNAGLNKASLMQLSAGFFGVHPDAVIEWMQDRDGALWIYDATLNNHKNASPHFSEPRNDGAVPLPIIRVGDREIDLVKQLTTYPLSVYAEDEEIRHALGIDLRSAIPTLSDADGYCLSASYPATELAVLLLDGRCRRIEADAGSILCHLALIARARGVQFIVRESSGTP